MKLIRDFVIGFFRLIEDLINCLSPLDVLTTPIDWTDGTD